jgi:hypothetical protein
LGIIAGLGRGNPGSPWRPPGANGARPAGGRDSPGRAPSVPGRGARGRPIPCEEEKGLLPGRGVPGRRVAGAPGSPPVDPGRGRGVAAPGASPIRAAGAAWPGARGRPGRGTDVGCGAVGALGGVAGAAGALGEVIAGASAATSTGAGAGGASAPSAAFAAAAFAADAFLAGAFLAGGGSLASFSLSRLSTGASTVEEADRTNSPMSFSMLRTVLLSTPSSFASS